MSSSQTFASTELAGAFPEIDLDRDGILSASEVERGARTLGAGIVDFTEIDADDEPCTEQFESARLDATDAVQVRASFACPADFAHLTIDCGFLDRLPADHIHLAVVSLSGHETSAVATQVHEEIDVDSLTRKSRRAFLAIPGGIAVGVAGCLAFLWRRRQSRADM